MGRYTVENPPPHIKSLTGERRRFAVETMNACLAAGISESNAIAASTIAGKGARALRVTDGPEEACPVRYFADAGNLQLRAWTPVGSRDAMKLGDALVPVRNYRKEVIKTGTYIKDSEGLVFQITDGTLNNWVAQFNLMLERGVKVPIPALHRDEKWEEAVRAGDPRHNMGYVKSLEIEHGDSDQATLVMSCQLIGDDAFKAAARSDVSLFSPPVFTDGKGDTYERPITHIAMVTDPVVPGLGEFMPIAASLRRMESKKMSSFIKQVAASFGLNPDEVTDDAAGEAMVIEKAKGLHSKACAMSECPEKDKPAIAASMAAAGSPVAVKAIRESREMKLSRLVEQGKMSPAQAKKLTGIYATDEIVKLSLSRGSDGSDFDQICEVFSLGETSSRLKNETGAQSLSLVDSRKDQAEPDPKKSPLVQDAERRRTAAMGK